MLNCWWLFTCDTPRTQKLYAWRFSSTFSVVESSCINICANSASFFVSFSIKQRWHNTNTHSKRVIKRNMVLYLIQCSLLCHKINWFPSTWIHFWQLCLRLFEKYVERKQKIRKTHHGSALLRLKVIECVAEFSGTKKTILHLMIYLRQAPSMDFYCCIHREFVEMMIYYAFYWLYFS